MAIGKSGKTEMGTVLMWVLIIGVVAYAANFGGFKDTVNGFFSVSPSTTPGSQGLTDTGSCPTDGTTTYTLNVQDALTATATNVNGQYYVFNGNKLIKEGSVSGSTTFDVACGKDYDLLLVNTTASTGAYAKTVKLQARIAEDTVNEKLTRFGGAKILGIENPADPSRLANVSIGAGATKQFDLKFVANETEKGYNKPMILCQVNVSSISGVSIGSFSDGTPVKVATSLPKRVTASTGYVYYGWIYDKLLNPTSGVITASGSITAMASVAPATTDAMTCKLVDQATWAKASYKTATSVADGFVEGPENTETLADVGGPDSSTATYSFVHAGGY